MFHVHGGVVETVVSALVAYVYSEGVSNLTNPNLEVINNNSRLKDIVYPNGRTLRYV